MPSLIAVTESPSPSLGPVQRRDRHHLLEASPTCQKWRAKIPRSHLALAVVFSAFIAPSAGVHHMKLVPAHSVQARDSSIPLAITNMCREDIYPAVLTQGGTGPGDAGFLLSHGQTKSQTVSGDWQGRVWGRTNCTAAGNGTNPASGQGIVCKTGDCGPFLACPGAGQPPATLAEFTLSGSNDQTFYDLSIVDGYNLPVGIIYLGTASNSSTADPDIPPNFTNPICIATAAQLAAEGDNSSDTFGTNASFPLPLDQTVSNSFVQGWCPWDLQVFPPEKPGDGVYPYPDDNIQRPLFNPCLSACQKWGDPQYCCTGKYSNPGSCKPSYFSTQAKQVCPDAYSYAYDDLTSTFIIPKGGGFEVVFCPPGRSTNILAVFGDQLSQLSGSGGMLTQGLIQTAQNLTYIKQKNDASTGIDTSPALLALVIGLAFLCLGDSWWW